MIARAPSEPNDLSRMEQAARLKGGGQSQLKEKSNWYERLH